MTNAFSSESPLAKLKPPPLQPIDTLFLSEEDTLLTCAGFEERSVNALNAAIKSGSRKFKVSAARYLPAVLQNRNLELERLSSTASFSLSWWLYDRETPDGAAHAAIDELNPTGRIFVDVSGMSRLLIVQMIQGLAETNNLHRTRLLYTRAQTYTPTKETSTSTSGDDPFGAALLVSTGIFGLTIVPELSSVAMQGQPVRLVAFPSWNTTQLAAICSEIQASQYCIINGVPPEPENAWRLGTVREINRIDTLRSRTEVNLSTLNYSDTLDYLISLYRTCGFREKIIISPTGSKMQTVAVGLFRAFHSDVQIVYPTPREFTKPDSYTTGCRTLYGIDLSPFADVVVPEN